VSAPAEEEPTQVGTLLLSGTTRLLLAPELRERAGVTAVAVTLVAWSNGALTWTPDQ